MEKILQCDICKQEVTGGIIINDKCICRQCEELIISTSPLTPEYETIKEQVKEILF